MKKWLATTELTFYYTLLPCGKFFSVKISITESQIPDNFLSLRRIFFSVVINDNLVSLSSVYLLRSKYGPSSEHRMAARQKHWLLEWLITRQILL
jgi:hypothetical protein